MNIFLIINSIFFSFSFPEIQHFFMILYLFIDSLTKSMNKKRDIQILVHHIFAILLIFQYQSINYQQVFILYSVLESSSCVLMLSRMFPLLKMFSKIYWIFTRIIWINWFHIYYTNFEYNIYFQFIKWLGYLWTLESISINLLPCHLSYLSSFELIPYIAFYHKYIFLGIFTSISIPISFLHHFYYTNKLFWVMDSIIVKLYTCYTTFLFYHIHSYMQHLIAVGCTFLFVFHFRTNDRSWNNLILHIPHMFMHIFAGNGIISALLHNH
jgi:hypothetical protein